MILFLWMERCAVPAYNYSDECLWFDLELFDPDLQYKWFMKRMGTITKGKYTYFDNGRQQWVIDYATDNEQVKFNRVTGLKREWLGEVNHFSEPKK